MLARRIIAVSPDKAFAKQLAVALKAAGGAVESHQGLDALGRGELQTSLLVIHLANEMAGALGELLPRLTGDARVIVILPKSNLAAVVDVMQASERITGVLVAEQLEMHELSAMATRILAGDIFGLEKLVPWGTRIHSALVGDYQEKSLCIAQISEFGELMGVRRKYRESIEQCVDEMLMNALYDAPVDEQGRPIFSEIPTKTRISLRVEQKVVVQYACDGKSFAVSVRDAFGTLERATVLRYLYKCLHAEQQIDRKTGGAGLGLYLISNSSTQVYFNVLPGVATEAVCQFNLETPKIQIQNFGFFNEKIDAGGRLAAGPSRRLPAGANFPVERRNVATAAATPKALVAGLFMAVLAMMALIVAVAWPRLMGPKKTSVDILTTPKGASIEIEGRPVGTTADGHLTVNDLEVDHTYPVTAKLDGYEPSTTAFQASKGRQVTLELKAIAAQVNLDSDPTGATIIIDGKDAGKTPLTVTTFTPSASVVITFKKTGYQDAVYKLNVPAPGKETRFVQPLSVSDDFARVKLTSEPAGAQVYHNGQLLPGMNTPCEVLVEAGKSQRFTLTLPKHVPVIIDPFTPTRGQDGLVKGGTLVEGVTLMIDAPGVDGKASVTGAPTCKNLDVPAECSVKPGKYEIDFNGSNGAKATRTFDINETNQRARFDFGFIEAPPGKQLQLASGNTVKKAAFEEGAHKVYVIDASGGIKQVTVRVKPGSTVVAN
jgi:hypothetical protein